MSAPSGYTALDFVGFTDKGTYNPLATYMRNDLVHYGGNIWKCLVDNTTGITPVEGANWTLWIGTSANLAERTIAPLLNNPADAAFGVGRQVIYDDWLWEVIAPIAIGDTLIDYAVDPTNANIKKSNPVETQLLAVKAEADATDNMIAPTETNASSSSAAYAVGDQLILNNILYTVTAPVTIGDALVSGTGGNIEASDNLTDQLADKVDSSDLGTAAAKDSTNAVTQNSTDLVESGAVYSEVNTVKQALTNKTDYVDMSSIDYSSYSNLATTLPAVFNDITITSRTITGKFWKGGTVSFVAYKYESGLYGYILAKSATDSNFYVLNVDNGVSTVRTDKKHEVLQTFTPTTNETFQSILTRVADYIKLANFTNETLFSLKLKIGNSSSTQSIFYISRANPNNAYGYYVFSGGKNPYEMFFISCRGTGSDTQSSYKYLYYDSTTSTIKVADVTSASAETVELMI